MASFILKGLSHWGSLLLVVATIGLPAAYADVIEQVEKGRNVQYPVKSEWVEVSDGHLVGFFESAGVGFHDTGEVTVITNKGTFDSIKGNSMSTGYLTKTFSDGSTYAVRWQGTTTPGSDHNIFEGTYEYTTGTGRFLGVTGGGKYWGRSHGNVNVVDYEGKLIVTGD